MSNDQYQISVQVLGSGGPMHSGGRGNSAYLLWRGHEPILVIDMGGDTPTALAKAGVIPGQLPSLVISHVHPDHVSGLPDFIWSEITAGRSLPLRVIGPPAGDNFRDANDLFYHLFSENGAFPDLSAVMMGTPFEINFVTASDDGHLDYSVDGMRVLAMRVNHGAVPTLAIRVEIERSVVVFAGDQTMDDPAFVRFASGADLMIAHSIVNERADGTSLSKTVATPKSIGTTAQGAQANQLVLSHWLGAPADAQHANLWSLHDREKVLSAVKRHYFGAVFVAEDMKCYELPLNTNVR